MKKGNLIIRIFVFLFIFLFIFFIPKNIYSQNNSTTSTSTFSGTSLETTHYNQEKLEDVLNKIKVELEKVDNEDDPVVKKIAEATILAKTKYLSYILENKDTYSPETTAYTAFSKAISIIVNSVDESMDFNSNTIKSTSNDASVNTAYVNIKNILNNINDEMVNDGQIIDNTNDRDMNNYNLTHNSCNTNTFMTFNFTPWGDSVVSNPNCSIISYIINALLSLLNWFGSLLLSLVISLFNWTIHFGIENFSNLVKNSGAYLIYQKVILALIVSLILPFVFYIILRSLIDNNLDRMKNILPRLLFTALFVYFSFTVAGMIIDQSNIFSLKVASTLNRSGQPLSDMINRIILQNDPSVNFSDASNAPPQSSSGATLYWGNPSTIPVYIIQVVITGAAIIVFFQAATLIFARALVLLLCLIFSPIMLLPSGINKKIDEYREKIITNFTNNVILAPIFLLLVLIAIKIGQVGRSLIDQAGNIQATGIDGAMIGSALSGVISVAVLMMAIKFAKQLSGDIGNNISGKISAFTGKLALGGLSMVTKGAVNSVAKSERFKGWVEKGGRTGRLAYNTMNRLQNSTFDLRNNETFKKATGGSFGRGTNLSAEDTYNRKYNKERKYHNLLNEEGKEKHLGRLDTSIAYSSIARDLRDKKVLSFEEDLKSNNKFNQSFDKANSEVNKDKREKKITEEIDKHFKENGKGDKHFSKELAKPENAELLRKFKEANKKTNKAERKTELLKVIKEFEDKANKQKQTQNNPQPQANTSSNRTGVIAGTSNAQAMTKNKLQRSNLDRERSLNAKAYADELAKVLKPIIGEYKREQTGRESFFNTATAQNDKATEKAINRNRRNNNQNPNPTSNSAPNPNLNNTLNNAA